MLSEVQCECQDIMFLLYGNYNIVKFPSILPALTFFDRHDITEILLKVALNTINPNPLLTLGLAIRHSTKGFISSLIFIN